MGLFSRRSGKRAAVIDLRHLACPSCGGTHTELGWMDRVARSTGHWCDDCGHAWKVYDGDMPDIADKPIPAHLRI